MQIRPGAKNLFNPKRGKITCTKTKLSFARSAGRNLFSPQEFYAEKGFVNEPQRCKPCRDARKNAAKADREMFVATCAACGQEARVPFKPREDRAVYCSDCFAKMREEQE